MFSVDNFYYILYKNLLESTRFTARYFYPFGTVSTKNLMYNWEKMINVHSDHFHSVLFYDQEPLLNEELPTYNSPILYSNQFCKLLANSEHSSIKKQICKNNNYLDWYYFYHGLASLSWFNDFKYLPIVEHQFTKVFISYNRLHTNHRSYRLHLISDLVNEDLLQYGNVSWPNNNKEFGDWRSELANPHTLLPKNKLLQIHDNLSKIKDPLVIDKANPQGFLSADCGTQALITNQSALWHIVTETIFYLDKLHLTEKIFKPIATRRPFILVAAPGNLQYLKSYGFQTFDRWIDESYDNETDHDKRISMIVQQVKKLCQLTHAELKTMHEEMREILDFNFNHFYNDFKTIIVDELLENFKTCCNIYNNGRFDDKDVPVDQINFASVRNTFLR